MSATYDAAGYLKQMSITRGGVAPQQYDYEWDEVGRLTRAARKDGGVVAAELTYAYDASDQRVRKSAGARHSVYVFNSLELRSTEFDGTGYTVDNTTEVPYLFGHGVRLARVTYTDAADFQAERRRIFLELGDHLGSTAVVMDRATGELVERSTAYAYGAAESHYRPARWAQFREDYRFTGKEDDIEVGLIYFGARYLNPQLGTWISADPLAVHAPGKADLNLYAYVHGKVLVAVDPVGLVEPEQIQAQLVATGGAGAPTKPAALRQMAAAGIIESTQSATTPPAPVSSTSVEGQGGSSGQSPSSVGSPTGAHGGPGSSGQKSITPSTSVSGLVTSMAPVVGEAMDLSVILDPDSDLFDRGICTVSLGLNIITGGVLPNAGAVVKAERAGAEATSDMVRAERATQPVRAGEAGRFADLDARARVGDELTPHHMPQTARDFTPRGEGGALVLKQGEHELTRTYGFKGRLVKDAEKDLSFRQTLYNDARDIRSQFGTKYDQGIRDLLQYFKERYPELLVKPE